MPSPVATSHCSQARVVGSTMRVVSETLPLCAPPTQASVAGPARDRFAHAMLRKLPDGAGARQGPSCACTNPKNAPPIPQPAPFIPECYSRFLRTMT